MYLTTLEVPSALGPRMTVRSRWHSGNHKVARNPGRRYHGCMFKRMVRHLGAAVAASIVSFILVPSPAAADEPDQGSALSDKRARFALGVGWIYADFSTTFETVQKDPEQRFFLSLEGDLGLPASSSVPTLDLLARVGKKSYIAANLGRFDRSRTLLEIDEDLHFDDLVLEVGADVDLLFNVTDVEPAPTVNVTAVPPPTGV